MYISRSSMRRLGEISRRTVGDNILYTHVDDERDREGELLRRKSRRVSAMSHVVNVGCSAL